MTKVHPKMKRRNSYKVRQLNLTLFLLLLTSCQHEKPDIDRVLRDNEYDSLQDLGLSKHQVQEKKLREQKIKEVSKVPNYEFMHITSEQRKGDCSPFTNAKDTMSVFIFGDCNNYYFQNEIYLHFTCSNGESDFDPIFPILFKTVYWEFKGKTGSFKTDHLGKYQLTFITTNSQDDVKDTKFNFNEDFKKSFSFFNYKRPKCNSK